MKKEWQWQQKNNNITRGAASDQLQQPQKTNNMTAFKIGDVVIFTNNNTNTEHEHTIEDVRMTSTGKTIYKLSNCPIMFSADRLKLKTV